MASYTCLGMTSMISSIDDGSPRASWTSHLLSPMEIILPWQGWAEAIWTVPANRATTTMRAPQNLCMSSVSLFHHKTGYSPVDMDTSASVIGTNACYDARPRPTEVRTSSICGFPATRSQAWRITLQDRQVKPQPVVIPSFPPPATVAGPLTQHS
jgi:hypothetical protein